MARTRISRRRSTSKTPRREACVATARMLQGKELSYNNIADADAALECVKSFDETACVIVKHANPCGVAVADNVLDAYKHAYVTDPTSAFGGIIAFNRALDAATAKELSSIANSSRSSSLPRWLRMPSRFSPPSPTCAYSSPAPGGNPVCGPRFQARHRRPAGAGHGPRAGDGKRPQGGHEAQTEARRNCAICCSPGRWSSYVKSNAIVYCKDGRTIGVGAGQMSRVYSARIASIKATDAGLEVRGSVMASDAFFRSATASTRRPRSASPP